MAWAQEMKNLAADINASHRDRTVRINGIRKETREILGAADDYIKNVGAELKEMARDLKAFLAKSEEMRKGNEEARKKDFQAMMGGIKAKVKEIRVEVSSFLARSEGERMADFKAMMKDIGTDIGAIKRAVETLQNSVNGLMAGYKGERKEAGRYWASIKGKGSVPVGEEPTPKAKKRGRREEEEE